MKIWLIILGAGLLSLSLFKHRPSPTQTQTNSPTQVQSLAIISGRDREEIPQQASNNYSAHIEIKDLHPQEVQMEIAEIETDLTTNNTIERLNEGIVEDHERKVIGRKLEHLNRLRIQDLEQEIQEIQKNLGELESRHLSRLRAFGVEKS